MPDTRQLLACFVWAIVRARRMMMVALGVLGAGVAEGQVLFDITFSGPTHEVGEPATAGLGIDTPSTLIFGSSVVVDVGGEHGQALQLLPEPVGSFRYSQYDFLFEPSGPYRYVRVALDLSISGMNPSGHDFIPGPDDAVTLLFDTPSVTRLDFIGDGSILTPLGPTARSTYTAGEWFTILVDVDVVQNTWSIARDYRWIVSDEQYFYPSIAHPTLSLQSFRINLADDGSGGQPTVLVDNFRVEASATPFAAIPEPTVSLSLLAGLGLLAAHRRFSPRGSRSAAGR